MGTQPVTTYPAEPQNQVTEDLQHLQHHLRPQGRAVQMDNFTVPVENPISFGKGQQFRFSLESKTRIGQHHVDSSPSPPPDDTEYSSGSDQSIAGSDDDEDNEQGFGLGGNTKLGHGKVTIELEESVADISAEPLEEIDFLVVEISDTQERLLGSVEIRRPDDIEDFETDNEAARLKTETENSGLTDGIDSLRCGDDDDSDSDLKMRKARWERKKKRWSSGIAKRTHSESIGNTAESVGDVRVDQKTDMHEELVGGLTEANVRRLRRRTLGLVEASASDPDQPKRWSAAQSVHNGATGQEKTSASGLAGSASAKPVVAENSEDLMVIDSGSI